MTEFDAITIGRRMAAIRAARGLTQDEVASRLGIHRNHYGKYERGKKLLHLTRLKEIAAALEVTIDELLLPQQADHQRRSHRREPHAEIKDEGRVAS